MSIGDGRKTYSDSTLKSMTKDDESVGWIERIN